MNTFTVLLLASCIALGVCREDEEHIRKSIIYDKKTPDVFYCPLESHDGLNNMLVKARPLKKLCEYGGQVPPEGYKSDCFDDVDETVWACKEKKRIMKRLINTGEQETSGKY